MYETANFTSKAIDTELFKHPRFFIRRDRGEIKYDIALLTLEQPVNFTQFPHIRQDPKNENKNIWKFYLRPVCLPDDEDIEMDLTNKFGIATGWGATALQRYRSDSRCDYHFGIQDPSHRPTKLKKLNLK